MQRRDPYASERSAPPDEMQARKRTMYSAITDIFCTGRQNIFLALYWVAW